MRRSIELRHGKFRAVLREPDRLRLKDFDEEDLEVLGRKPDHRFKEYRSLGFPVWTRMDLRGIDVSNFRLKKQPTCDLDRLFEEYDFEGADRKYTLMADIFHTEKYCFDGSGEMDLELKDGISTVLAVVRGKVDLKMNYSGRSRVSTGRFLLKRGSRLKIVDESISQGIEISSYYFYLEPGAKLEFHQGTVGKGSKVAKFVMVDGEGDFEAEIFPRVGSIESVIDVMYSSVVEGSSSVIVDGRGFTRSGKIVFRGVMDARKSSKEAKLSEKFECLFMDEESAFEAIPSLFISENELSAEHGVTAYRIPEDRMFYLMSRGFEKAEVERMVAEGMFEKFENLKVYIGEKWG